MGITWRQALTVAAVLFLLFLVLKMRPSWRGRRKVVDEIRAARQRAHAARSPDERARALCDAAKAAVRAGRWNLASGFFLRAVNARPASPVAIEEAAQALGRARPHLLEMVLWRRLALHPWDGEHRASAHAAAVALRQVYEHRLVDSAKAEFMRRLARSWEGERR